MCIRCLKSVAVFLLFSFVVGCSAYQQQPTVTAGAQLKSAEMARVDVPGGSLEYSVSGRGEPVLLIHGSIFADVFPRLLPEPALASYRLITYHRRGFAGSTLAPMPFTIEQQAADAIALLDKLGIRRAHVVGHSYGGAIALELARQYPDRIATLSLFEAAVPAVGTMDPKVIAAANAALELYRSGDRRGAVMRFANAVTPGAWDAMTAGGATAMQEQAVQDIGTFFDVEMPALQQWSFSAVDLGSVRAPTLVVMGEQSASTRGPAHAAILKAISGAQELVVRGAGHGLQMAEPTAVAEGLAAFLQQHRGAR